MTDDQIKVLRPIIDRVWKKRTATRLPNGEGNWGYEPLTGPLIAKHLNGGPPRGVVAITPGTSVTMLALFDLDSHKGETPWHEMLIAGAKIASEMERSGLRPTAFRSTGGKGLHIYALWDAPQDGYSVLCAMYGVLERCGFRKGIKGVASGEVEVFPKRDYTDIDKCGSMFILPLAGQSESIDLLRGESLPLNAVAWRSSEPVAFVEKPVRVSLPDGVVSLATIESALWAIPNESRAVGPDYDQYRDIIFGIYEVSGGSEEGFQIALTFSLRNADIVREKGAAAVEEFLRNRMWRYIKPGGGITHGSILYRAREQYKWNRPHELDFVDVETDECAGEVRDYKALVPLAAGLFDPLFEGDRFVAIESPVHADDVIDGACTVLGETSVGVGGALGLIDHAQISYGAAREWALKIGDATDDFNLRESVCAQIAADARLTAHLDREAIAQALMRQFKAIGTVYTLANCRALIAPPKKVGAADTPEWLKGWVYVTDVDKFFRVNTCQWVTVQGFRARYDREGMENSAIDALTTYRAPTVTRSVYIPWADSLFVHDGTECVNTYRKSSTPKPIDVIDVDGYCAIAVVKRHLFMFFGGREWLVDIMLAWIAHNVQKPGVKIRWAPLIKGIPGDGKTLLGKLMSAIMGEANVKNVSPHALSSPFTAWAEGSCVAVLEEVRIIGENRFEVFNALKPYITNDAVPCMRKGKDEVQIVNVTNYLGFTNYNDAMPIDETDRRWMVVFSPFTEIKDLQKLAGMDAGVYFDTLHDLIEKNRASLRRFFLDHQIPESFKPNGVAPHTLERALMISGVQSEEEAVFMDALRDGGVGIGPNIVIVSCLVHAMTAAMPVAMGEINGNKITKWLQRKGWMRVDKRVYWRGEQHRVWIRGVNPTDSTLHQNLLDLTAKVGEDRGLDTSEFFAGGV